MVITDQGETEERTHKPVTRKEGAKPRGRSYQHLIDTMMTILGNYQIGIAEMNQIDGYEICEIGPRLEDVKLES